MFRMLDRVHKVLIPAQQVNIMQQQKVLHYILLHAHAQVNQVLLLQVSQHRIVDFFFDKALEERRAADAIESRRDGLEVMGAFDGKAR